jgi:hypothetical protein
VPLIVNDDAALARQVAADGASGGADGSGGRACALGSGMADRRSL